ncbi:MAG: hypothetical protein IIX90_01930 [Clostridia bacterium]|nr:hypothetical protein [Clostridia bacterium]
MSQQNKKKFNLFNPMRDGKGVEKGEDTRPTLRRFFKLWGRKWWRLVTVNFIMLVQIIPLVVCAVLYFAGPKMATQYSPLYPTLLGAQTALPTSAGMTLFNSAAGLLHQSPIYNSWAHWVMAALIIFQLVTYGWQKVGSTYILRNMVRGDGVFIISDFFYAIRRNLKQGFFMGLIDCVVIGTLAFDFLYFYNSPGTGLNDFMYVVILALALIYCIMRFYTYLMLVTFDMKIGKIFKNALIFTALGIKRNLMALLGIAGMVGVFVALILLLVPFKIYAIMIVPVLCVLAFAGFMYTYAAYPIIQRYMIDPSAPKVAVETEDEA